MGQYYLPYLVQGNEITVFDNKVDDDWVGLKLMEHSYWGNTYVGQVINALYYKKGNVCWVGDYYNEDDYSQVNCDKETVKMIGELVWKDNSPIEPTKGTKHTSRRLNHCLLVNHTKKLYIDCDNYFKQNKWVETYEGKKYNWCIHPLPLLTCTASHSGGSYYGINKDLCGTWFNDLLEVIDNEPWEIEDLKKQGYKKFTPRFSEREQD